MQGNTLAARWITFLVEHRAWRHVALACTLVLCGCGDSGSSELQVVAPEGCSPDDPAVVFQLTAVRVPTSAQADAGAVVGHDLDGVDGACDVPDYAGSVDNSLVDLAAAFALLAPEDPFVLEDVVNEALFCTSGDVACTPPRVGVRVQECRRGALVSVFRETDSACEVLGTATAADVGPGGELHAEFDTLAFDDAFEDPHGVHQLFELVNARLTATITADGLSNAVLGGVLPVEVFQSITPNFLPLEPGISFPASPASLSDIMLEPDGACDGLSMGLTLSAVVDASGESCE